MTESDMAKILAEFRNNPNRKEQSSGLSPLQKNIQLVQCRYPELFSTEEAAVVALCKHAFAWAAAEYLATNGKDEGRIAAAVMFALFLNYVEIPARRGEDFS